MLTLGYLGLILLAVLGITSEFRRIDEGIETLARERGSVLFRLVELTRDWNAQHGGVYVRVTEDTQPNPYLNHPKRDLETVDGIRLTMINPAFMTRQIAEIAEAADGVKYHITSLKPIRPANAADPWEAAALASFEHKAQHDVLSLVQTEDGPVHRYMAPLVVKQACLACHASQGYKVGDIRGGISVTMPAAKALAVRSDQRQRAVLIFSGAALAIALLLHLAIWRSRRYFLQLRALTAGQEALIVERTQALSAANARLLDEVAERKHKEALISESEARYRSVIETSQDAILIMAAPEFIIVFVNERAASMFGLTQEEVLNRRLLDFVHPLDRPLVAERLARRARGEAVSATARLRFSRPDGAHMRVADVHVARIENAVQPKQWVFSAQDVTDLLENQRALQIAAAVMESVAEGIVVTDAENHIIQVNPAFTAITGYRPQEVLGKDPGLLASGRHGQEFFRDMWHALAQVGHWEGELWNRRPDATVYVVWMAISTIRDEAVESGGRHVATFIDITLRKEMEERLRHQAQSDPLTDLPNRALFDDRLKVVLAQAHRYGDECALLYVDLDHFKAVNDSMGHAAGDELLVETARRLTRAVRESDTVARLGGDEFAVILPKISNHDEVEEIAQRIVAMLSREFRLAGGEVNVSGSVGVAIYPQNGHDPGQLAASADAALYAAKQGGRNTYRIQAPGLFLASCSTADAAVSNSVDRS
ncbi:MAG TPA: diguanylate cyclase [Azonexus sp.]|nr:diguanylate cyclase [Azonexus sp.]